jgi:hypothetical protein
MPRFGVQRPTGKWDEEDGGLFSWLLPGCLTMHSVPAPEGQPNHSPGIDRALLLKYTLWRTFSWISTKMDLYQKVFFSIFIDRRDRLKMLAEEHLTFATASRRIIYGFRKHRSAKIC